MAVGRARDDSAALGGVVNGYPPLDGNLQISSNYIPSNVGGLHLLEQHSASSSATLDFTSFISSSYDEYAIEILNLIPATDNVYMHVQMSTDGGATFDSGSNYQSSVGYFYSGGVGVANATSDSTTAIRLADTVGSDSTYGFRASLKFISPQSTSVYKSIMGIGQMFHATLDKNVGFNIVADYRSTSTVNALRFLFSSGNISSGTIRIYGVAKSVSTSSAGLQSGMVLLEQHDASSSSSLDFTTFINSAYDDYMIEVINLLPATNNTHLNIRMGTGSPSSFDSGSNYTYAIQQTGSGGSFNTNSTSATAIRAIHDINTGTSLAANGTMHLYGLNSSSAYKAMTSHSYGRSSDSNYYMQTVGGSYQSTTVVTGIQFLMSSGNITSGTIRVYGIPKTFGLIPSYGGVSGGFAPLDSNITIPQVYIPKTGTGAPGMILLEQHTASSSAQLDFTSCITSTYDTYEIVFIGIIPATNAALPYLRFSTNGGSSYDSGANYDWGYFSTTIGSNSTGGSGSASQTEIALFNAGLLSSALPAMTGNLYLYDPLNTSNHKRISAHIQATYSGDSLIRDSNVGGVYKSTTAVNAFRFLMSTGNIASGTIRVYGIPK